MKRTTVLLAGVCLLVPSGLRAQENPSYDLRAKPDSWLAPLSISAAIGTWFLVGSRDSLSMEDLSRLSLDDIPAFDRPATLFSSKTLRTASDISFGVAVIAPLFVLQEFDDAYAPIVAMYAETMALTTTLTNLAKLSGRRRPIAYNTDVADDERRSPDMRNSFFSGHTSASMAAGVFLATVYERFHPGTRTSRTLWVGGVGLGLLTGSLRVLSGMHYPSDVLAGAIVGALMGYAIPRMHESVQRRQVVLLGSSVHIVDMTIVL